MLPPGDPTLGDHLDEWLDRRCSHIRPTTHRGYRQSVRCYIRPHLGDVQLSEVDRLLLPAMDEDAVTQFDAIIDGP